MASTALLYPCTARVLPHRPCEQSSECDAEQDADNRKPDAVLADNSTQTAPQMEFSPSKLACTQQLQVCAGQLVLRVLWADDGIALPPPLHSYLW